MVVTAMVNDENSQEQETITYLVIMLKIVRVGI